MHARPPWPQRELPPFGGNSQLGCGLAVRNIKGHRYLYFWAYEERSWGSRRIWTYLGPVASAKTARRARELLMAYHLRVRSEVDRRIQRLLAAGTI